MSRWSPSTTVAAIIERDGRYLLIEEHTPEGLRLNNPAGHLDPGESPQQGVVREALEETMRAFEPQALVGIYLSRFLRPASAGREAQDVTYVRYAYCGTVGEELPGHALDTGIVRTLWMTPQHRSPLVLRCIEDHIAGRRFPRELVSTDASVFAPALKT